jgi:thiol-disulfide isomerase/thioredoxin
MRYTWNKNLFLACFCLFFANFSLVSAQKGYNIKVKLENYASPELVIGFHFGEKQYVKDTVKVGPDGYFTFKADTLFAPGVYLLVMKPDNNFIQVLLPADDQDMTLSADTKDIVSTMKVKGSTDNEVFYDYLRYLGKLRPESDTLRAQLNRTKGNVADSTRLANRMNELDQMVRKYQSDMLAKHANTVAARIVKASIEPDVPQFSGDAKEVQRKRYYYYREHYFDNLNIGDPVMLRTPVLHQKIDYYVTKVLPQHPDSINLGIDMLLANMQTAPEIVKYYTIHFLNYYAKTKLVGFDACYVHIGKKYYCNGKAPWANKEDLEKICDNVARLEPILIGKTAPNIVVKDRNNQNHALYDVDADFTVLFFWAPDCGHCKTAAPFMVDFAKKYKDRGVKVFAMCTAVTDKANDCWKGIEEKGFDDNLFLNYYDPYISSRYKTLYDVQTTPQIFILDRKHTILMKRISAEQLDKTMEDVMRFEQEKAANKGK